MNTVLAVALGLLAVVTMPVWLPVTVFVGIVCILRTHHEEHHEHP